MKTKQTTNLEIALENAALKKREYGCAEVTIGFVHNGHGDEIVDFMSMDASGIIKCYEIKVSMRDLKSENKLSWYGDYNYLVINRMLYTQIEDYDLYIPPYVGVIVSEDLQTVRPAKRKNVDEEMRSLLKDSLLRSIYWKMMKYKEASDTGLLQELKKDLQTMRETYEKEVENNDRLRFDVNEFETLYRKNHHDEHFTLAKASLTERLYALEKKRWIPVSDAYQCPHCSTLTTNPTPYCPHCGRKIYEGE